MELEFKEPALRFCGGIDVVDEVDEFLVDGDNFSGGGGIDVGGGLGGL